MVESSSVAPTNLVVPATFKPAFKEASDTTVMPDCSTVSSLTVNVESTSVAPTNLVIPATFKLAFIDTSDAIRRPALRLASS